MFSRSREFSVIAFFLFVYVGTCVSAMVDISKKQTAMMAQHQSKYPALANR
jgi:hypothetical protein